MTSKWPLVYLIGVYTLACGFFAGTAPLPLNIVGALMLPFACWMMWSVIRND